MSVAHLQSQGEDLKEAIWAFLDAKNGGKDFQGIKEAMNGLLDCIDLLEDMEPEVKP